MAPSTMRKALGVVKDQTSIGLAKVSSNMAPELDVLVVKVTSHDDMPAEERHLREILHLTSCSRSYVSYCVSAVSRRLGKTRDWMVALKSLMLIHRLLADGDPSFHQEVLYATRRGTRLLNLSDFRDEAHSKSWDHSAFVRTYALYLDQRLEFFLHERKNSSIPASHDQNQDRFRSPDPYQERRRHSDAYQDRYRSPDPYSHGDGSNGRYDNGGNSRFDNGSNSRYDNGGNSRFDNGSNGRYDNGNYRKSPSYGASPSTGRSPPPYMSPRDEENKKLPTPVRDMKPEQVLVRMHHLQQLLDRFLACRPTGIAKHDRMILVALYPIIRESFQLYADVCEVLGVLLDRFFDMEYNECVKSFEAYASAAKQIDELCAFYSWCKETGVARSSEYPEVQKITEKLLETLEEFMRDRAKRSKSPEPAPEPELVKEEEPPVEDMNSIKALPPPEDWKEEEPAEPVKEEVQEPPPPPPPEEPLVDLREDNVTADEQGSRLALALFSGPPANGSNGSWNAFGSSDDSNVTSAWQNPAAEPGKADWELALVETASNLSKQKANLPGGMDPLLLNGMYDQGAVKQLVNANVTTGSASSVALPLPGKATQVLALPAPDGSMQTIGGDPFAASLSIPPPAYVQMSEMEKKQQLLVQEQQVWNQYQRDGMQGQASLAKLDRGFNNGFGAAGFIPNPSIPYGMPMAYAGNPGYYYPAY